MIDYVDPFESEGQYTAANFFEDCKKKMLDLWDKGKIPMLVGGTGFYLEWILYGRPQAPPTDPRIEKQVEAEVEKDNDNWELSYNRLHAVDPIYAKTLYAGDYYRLVRALTVHRMTGRPLSDFKEPVKAFGDVEWNCFYLTDDRIELYRKVDYRCELMVQKGLFQEVHALMKNGLNEYHMAAKSIGYADTIRFLKKLQEYFGKHGSCFDDYCIDLFRNYLNDFMSHSRQYVRRQETWFLKKPNFHWISRAHYALSEIAEIIKTNLEKGDFMKSIDRLSREQKNSDKLKKIMRTYSSVPRVYSNREKIKNELRGLEDFWGINKGSL